MATCATPSQKKRRASGDDDATRELSLSSKPANKRAKIDHLDSSMASVDTLRSNATANSIPASPSSGQNVKVVARVRPLSNKEIFEHTNDVVKAVQQSSSIQIQEGRSFEYDVVFGPDSSQADVYQKTVGDLVQTDIFNGFNVTVLAYGQTGAGKTFTMGAASTPPSQDISGEEQNALAEPTEMDGVIPRAVYDLFQTQRNLNDTKQIDVEMSYLEIYNEEARDLLNADPTAASNLHIRDGRQGVYVQNLSWVKVASPQQVNHLMDSASHRRATASTQMNAVSSRSHAICTLRVSITETREGSDATDETPEEGAVKTSRTEAKLTLVDLAGSERIKRTGAEGSRMREGININKGLFVLGQVVSCLAEIGQRSSSHNSSSIHVPYRDSKLTRLLQDSLGGNSRTVMVACVSPADSNTEESINTLRYAQRARNIKNSAVKNVSDTKISAEAAAALRLENETLKSRVVSLESQLQNSDIPALSGQISPSTVSVEMTKRPQIDRDELVVNLRTNITSLESKVEQLETQVEVSSQDVLSVSLRADRAQAQLEAIRTLASSQGVELGNIPKQDMSLSSNMRNEIESLKSQLAEARMDAEVARSTAASIVLQNGDLAAAEASMLQFPTPEDQDQQADDDTDDGDSSDGARAILSGELAAVTEEIEKKEEWVERAQREHECMERMRVHFVKALKRLQDEETTLSTEKQDLVNQLEEEKVSTKEKNGSASKLQHRIKQLESNIENLQAKVASHKRCLRLKEMAESKCAKLAAEIEADKRRRSVLQKQLKEQTDERRQEQKEAKKQAMKLMRSSEKLQRELQKVRAAADRQASLLHRKIADISRKEDKRVVTRRSCRQRKQKQQDHVSEDRAAALSAIAQKCVSTEVVLLKLRNDIIDQEHFLEDADDQLNRTGDRCIQDEISSRKATIAELERRMDSIRGELSDHPTIIASNDHGETVMAGNDLSSCEVKALCLELFKQLVNLQIDLDSFSGNEDERIARAVRSAITKEKKKAEEQILHLQIEQAEEMATLLDSTRSTLEIDLKSQLEGCTTGDELSSTIQDLMTPYWKECDSIGANIKMCIQSVQEKQDTMESFVDEVAVNMISTSEQTFQAKKKTTKSSKKKSLDQAMMKVDEAMLLMEGDEADQVVEDGDDSDWSPDTPALKRSSRISSNQLMQIDENPDGDASEDGASMTVFAPAGEEPEQQQPSELLSLDELKVTELKKRLRELGLKVSGKKSELKERLTTHYTYQRTTLKAGGDDVEISSPHHGDHSNKKDAIQTSSSRKPLGAIENVVKRGEGASYMQQTKTSSAKRLSQAFFVDGNENGDAHPAYKVSRRTRRRHMTDAVNSAMLEFSKLDDLLSE